MAVATWNPLLSAGQLAHNAVMKPIRKITHHVCLPLVLLVVTLTSGCRGMQIRQLERKIDQLESRVSHLEGRMATTQPQ